MGGILEMVNFREFLLFVLIVAILHFTGIWPYIARALRDLRDERRDVSASSPASRIDLEICYKMLGVSPSAPWSEIESAYRRKARKHHPDHGGDEDAMRALNDAYRLLKNLAKRQSSIS